jgi:hypothetical protein
VISFEGRCYTGTRRLSSKMVHTVLTLKTKIMVPKCKYHRRSDVIIGVTFETEFTCFDCVGNSIT